MTPPAEREIPDEDLFTDDLLDLAALMQSDEDDEAVYGWMVEGLTEPAG